MKRRVLFTSAAAVFITVLVFMTPVVQSDIGNGLPCIFSEQVEEEWSARYNGPGNYIDQGNDIAVDASGNVYVTGQSYGAELNDPVTIKYDPEGNQLWLARYYNEGRSGTGVAIALDEAGNAYVTGYFSTDNSFDYFTVKYDVDGNEEWVSLYDGPGHSEDRARDIILDVYGDVYITGESYGTGNQTDCATVKYNGATGDEIRVVRYDGPENGDDAASAIVLDTDNNIYITGYTYSGSTMKWDYITIKYDAFGREQWVAVHGHEDFGDFAADIAVDSENNVYVTGKENGYEYVGRAYATIKYDTDGNELWVAHYENGWFNEAVALAVDQWDNVYVTGTSDWGQSDRDYLTIKYDTDGNELWAAQYNGTGDNDDSAYDMAIDESGNVYVTGTSYEGEDTEGNYVTVKYDTDGNERWGASYTGPGEKNDDAYSIALDGCGNAYVTGSSQGDGTSWDFATVKYFQAMILDDADPEFFVHIGEQWPVMNYPDAYSGSTHYHSPGEGDNIVAWRVDTTINPGNYDVYTWKFDHPFSGIMATDAQFIIKDKNGISGIVSIDQSTAGDEWIYLGNYDFDNSNIQGVGVTDEADGYVIADAIKLVCRGP